MSDGEWGVESLKVHKVQSWKVYKVGK